MGVLTMGCGASQAAVPPAPHLDAANAIDEATASATVNISLVVNDPRSPWWKLTAEEMPCAVCTNHTVWALKRRLARDLCTEGSGIEDVVSTEVILYSSKGELVDDASASKTLSEIGVEEGVKIDVAIRDNESREARMSKWVLLSDGVCVVDTLGDGVKGNGIGQLNEPHGSDSFAEDGAIVVADTGNHRLQVFKCDACHKYEPETVVGGSLGSGARQQNRIYGVAITNSGNVAVADTGNHRVQVFKRYGHMLYTSGSGIAGPGPTQYDYPSGIGTDTSEAAAILVADTNNHRIRVLKSFDGTPLNTIGQKGNGPYEFDYPCCIAVDNKYNLVYVADTGNHRVSVFTSNWEHVRMIGGVKGNGPDELDQPHGVAVDSERGYLFVADTFNDRVQVFRTSDASFVRTIGSSSEAMGQFIRPYGVSVDEKRGHIAVSDTNNHRVQILRCRGIS